MAFFWCELPPYLANNSKTRPLTPMLMKCDLYRQSHLKLTQDSSSHKGTPLPICTITENHREVHFKLFPVDHCQVGARGYLAPLGDPCSRRGIGVLIDFHYRVTLEKCRLGSGQQEISRKEDPKPACQSRWLWPECDTSSQGADARAQSLKLQGQEGCLQVTVGAETRTATVFPWRPQSL